MLMLSPSPYGYYNFRIKEAERGTSKRCMTQIRGERVPLRFRVEEMED